jgi:mono/diheme cytochrome c family protein
MESMRAFCAMQNENRGPLMFKLIMTCTTVWVASTVGCAAQAPTERGKYLVDSLMACDGCHTPRPGGVFNMERRFSGGSQVWDEHAYTVRGSNITSDRETGIGSWSADNLKRLLREGIRPNGVKVAPQMPFVFYQIMTPGDMDSLVAYVRSAPPLRNEVPAPVYKTEMNYYPIPNAEKPFSDDMMTDPVKRGFYLSTLGHCMECHSRRPDGAQDYKNWYGKGGAEFTGPFGTVLASNISSHPIKGIGAMTDDQIKRVLTQGIGRDGRALKPPMARQVYFAKMTEADINAIVAWVRTIPPIE